MHPGESVVEIQPRSHGPHADMADSNGQPALLPGAHDGQPGLLLDHSDPVAGPADDCLPAESPWWFQPLSIWPLKFCCCQRKTKSHPSNAWPILLSAIDWCFTILSSIRLFFFPLHPSFHRYQAYCYSVETCQVESWCRQDLDINRLWSWHFSSFLWLFAVYQHLCFLPSLPFPLRWCSG